MSRLKIGRMMAGLRGTAGLTQAQLAARMGSTDKSLQDWENDRVLPRLGSLVDFGAAVGVPAWELLRRAMAEVKS